MLLSLLLLFSAPPFQGWEVFANVRFKFEYVEEFGFEAEMPKFDDDILAKQGMELILEGYHLPLEYDRKTIVLSKLPYASCFF